MSCVERPIAEEYETFVFDLDGVVYVGEQMVPEAADVLHRLRDDRRTIRFLTNDPRPTREAIVQRLNRAGIAAHVNEVTSSGSVAAAHVQKHGFKCAYVVGSTGLKQEIEQIGVSVRGTGNTEETDVVVVGCDENVGYHHIARATTLIRSGAAFVATNADATFPTVEGRAPATGAIVAAIRHAAGRCPGVVGKPEGEIFERALGDCSKDSAIMIGDTIETDVVGAHRFGMKAALLSDKERHASWMEEESCPDLIISRLTDIFTEELAGGC